MSELPDWNEEQWGRVRQAVHDEALRARVAASFLPLFGPLPADTQTVPTNSLQNVEGPPGTQMRLGVNDYDTIRLSTVSVNVYLKNAQLADPELTSALMMFRRAAEIVARMEDAIVFNGQGGVGSGPKKGLGAESVPPVYQISGGGTYEGLMAAGAQGGPIKSSGDGDPGQQVFKAVVAAIGRIENAGFGSPFACVLGNDLFEAVTSPMPGSMVLPRDSILPFLNGPLVRSGGIPGNQGLVVGLQGQPVELVVPSDISVRFLQTTADGESVFRVQQKFVLRIKDGAALATIKF